MRRSNAGTVNARPGMQEMAVDPLDVDAIIADLLVTSGGRRKTQLPSEKQNDRGVSYCFGPDVAASFLAKHGLDLIVRAHQVVEDGYEFFAGRRLVTLFSAPNYCGEFDNSGALMEVRDDLECSFKLTRGVSKSHAK